MRESRTFAERTQQTQPKDARKKYYLIYEGAETEYIYFDAVNTMRSQIGISPLIELVPVIRGYSEKGWSNPKKILNRVMENLEESRVGSISYETLLNRIMEYIEEESVIAPGNIQHKSIWNTLNEICCVKLRKTLKEKVSDINRECNSIVELLQEEYGRIKIFTNIAEVISIGEFTYSEGYDKICFIVDRDRGSFLSRPDNNQYEYVQKICREKGFGLCISNPNFEFWLLLHFEEVFELDKDKLLNNPMSTSKRRYTEWALRRLLPGFRKSSYRAEKIIKNIDKAIRNEEKFCEDIEELESKLGCNIGRLIVEMKTGEQLV